MRKIKFRGWNKKARIMVDFLSVTPLALDSEMNNQLALQGGSGIFIPFLPEIILMQYIGLKDKNGKEVYEGDFLKWKYQEDDKSCFSGIVDYADRVINIGYEADKTRFVGFTMRCQDKGEEWFSGFPNLKDIEIIGNIYENPELIQEVF